MMTEPKRCSLSTTGQHNLNLQMYSFREILGLFRLDGVSTLTADHMKQAKQTVLRMHPDKSRLPSQYFLFYKKAFDMVAEYYDNQTKTDRAVPSEPMQYTAPRTSGLSRAAENGVQDKIRTMKATEFQTTFNRLYEENMRDREEERRREERNQWFKTEDATADWDTYARQGGDIHQKFRHIKQAQASQQMALYRGVQPLVTNRGMGDSFHGGADDAEDAYITTDPFGKLKFDDLRKVHKDQTVLSVSERDVDQVTQYGSVDKLRTARRDDDHAHPVLDKREAQRVLDEQEAANRRRFEQRQHAAKLQTMQYQEKNAQVLSGFMYLGNG